MLCVNNPQSSYTSQPSHSQNHLLHAKRIHSRFSPLSTKPESLARAAQQSASTRAGEMAYQGNAKAQELSNDTGFDDPRIIKDMIAGGKQAKRIERFLSLLAVCHTVVVEKDADVNLDNPTTTGGAPTVSGGNRGPVSPSDK